MVGQDRNGKIEIRRRYKEFDALHNKLKQNYPGIFIPPIPEKAIFNTSQDLIAERLLFLDHFVKKCSKLDHIYYSDEMQFFLHFKGSSDELIKCLNNIQQKSHEAIFERYKSLFPEFDKTIEESEKLPILERTLARLNSSAKDCQIVGPMVKKMLRIRPRLENEKAG